ncbi:MAG: agmatinase [Lentisphaerae bacterium]|nr:agmatinase [Lentisphaerota bacterium]
MTRPIHRHFLDIPAAAARDAAAPFAVLPLPYERTVSFGTGAAGGPAAVLDASHEVEDFDEELRQPLDFAVQTLAPPELNGLDDEAALERIAAAAGRVLGGGRFLLAIGGEHTVTYPLVKAARDAHPELSVLHLDAHLDLRDTYEGTRWSHACVMRRVRELGVATVHLGMRSWSAAEQELVAAAKLPVYPAAAIPAAPDDAWLDRLLEPLAGALYVSVDIDALDPALAPGTGTPEPGGLAWRQLLAILRGAFARRTVVAADIVEVAPIPGARVTEFAAARLGAKMLAYRRFSADRRKNSR